MKSLRDEAKSSQSSKMERMIGRALSSSNLAPEPKVDPKTSTKAMGGVVSRATGGAVNAIPGRASGGRLDKKGRKSGTNVNIVIAPQGGGDKPMPIPVPAGGPPIAPSIAPPLARPPMAGPGGMPPGAPPMGPGGPPMRARGGKVKKRADGGGLRDADGKRLSEGDPSGPPVKAKTAPWEHETKRATGGKVYPKMEAGAGSGEGREEKIAKYGKNAKA